MKHLFTIGLLSGIAVLSGCDDKSNPVVIDYPDAAEVSTSTIIKDVKGVKVYIGGFGSALQVDPNDASVFYMLTDRGPNVDGAVANSKIFSNPEFVPQIGKFRLKGTELVLESTIELKNENGGKLNGLPNPVGQGNSGETAYDLDGKVLSTSADGIDSEGMVLASDGSFWISDEYGPHIVHFDASGVTLERINPFGSGKGGRKIPLVFAKRRPNRGMEGLTITPDGKTLVGMMQFPLYNPSSAAVSGSLVIRILTFDIASGNTKQYVYLMEKASLQANSEIAAITSSTFLVLERDGEFPTDANRANVIKKIYKIDLSAATDISDPSNDAGGKLFSGKTVEELKDAATLAANGITPVTKTLAADLMTDVSSVYPHDKAEGLVIINSTLIAISNDDDFGITTGSPLGTYVAKTLPATNAVDKNRIVFIKLKTAL